MLDENHLNTTGYFDHRGKFGLLRQFEAIEIRHKGLDRSRLLSDRSRLLSSLVVIRRCAKINYSTLSTKSDT